MKRVLLLIVALVLSLGAAAYYFLYTPYQSGEPEKFITIERGDGTLEIADKLADAGVVPSNWAFIAMRGLKPSANLQAGEYRFARPSSVATVFSRISKGDVFYVELTVPEGSNMFDIAQLVDGSGIIHADDFLKAAADPAPIQDLAPKARTQEGFLFPDTYRITHATTAEQLCRMMTGQFRKEWKKLNAPGVDTNGVVTLASLVEKETGVAEERPLVAGVFTNRLNQHMRLECDPTTIYAALLEQRYSGKIHRSDLNNRNPYNTYQNEGLPPGPIANPGRASLEAALHPAQTDYLYFVAKPSGGGHQFSATLTEHGKAVRQYRAGVAAKAAKGN